MLIPLYAVPAFELGCCCGIWESPGPLEERLKKKIRVIVVLLVVVAAVSVYLSGKSAGSAGAIRVSGNIETTEVQLSFNVAGMIKERLVDEGAGVKAGDVVARLDSAELAQVVSQAEAALDVAAAEGMRLNLEFVRQKDLFEKKVISNREYELADAARSVSDANLKHARATLELARTRLSYATLSSPVSGVVLSTSAERGEHVVPGSPVVNIGELTNVWLRAYIEETELGRVKLGQKAQVRIDGAAGKVYAGTVSFISSQAEFTPKSVQTPKERVKLVYRIKVDLPNPALDLKPGMPADAEITVP